MKKTADVFDLPVHPAADLFPMLGDDELQTLAESIKANGLLHPLVVKDGLLIDGRNRRVACQLAGVVPDVMELNGEDPAAYCNSMDMRRNISKSQKAMVFAVRSPEPAKGGRVKTSNSVLNTAFSNEYVSRARSVLAWAPDLQSAVLSGALPLNDAYATALHRKRAIQDS
jgi:hypothetical protein